MRRVASSKVHRKMAVARDGEGEVILGRPVAVRGGVAASASSAS